MARLREEHKHGESDEEFPDVSVIIGRFYQNKLSNPASKGRDGTKDSQHDRRRTTPTTDPTPPTPDAKHPLLKIASGSLAEANTFDDSLNEDESFVLKL